MIGLVLVTHGRLADEFVTAMVHVVGPQEQVATIAIGPDDDMESRRADFAEGRADALGMSGPKSLEEEIAELKAAEKVDAELEAMKAARAAKGD